MKKRRLGHGKPQEASAGERPRRLLRGLDLHRLRCLSADRPCGLRRGRRNVLRQGPAGSSADRRQALQALLACPTGSIGCLGDDDVKAVMEDFPLVDRGAGLLLRLQLAEVVWRQQLLHPAPRRQLADRLAEVRHAARAAVGGAGRHRPHLPDAPGRRGRRRALRRALQQPPHHSSGRVVVAARCGSRPRRRRAVGVGSRLPRHPDAGPHEGPLRPALSGPLPLHRRPPGLGPGRAAACRPPRTTAGTRGRSRPSRWGGWRTIASSGCCPATARRCICPPPRCGSKSCAWPSRCRKGADDESTTRHPRSAG